MRQLCTVVLMCCSGRKREITCKQHALENALQMRVLKAAGAELQHKSHPDALAQKTAEA